MLATINRHDIIYIVGHGWIKIYLRNGYFTMLGSGRINELVRLGIRFFRYCRTINSDFLFGLLDFPCSTTRCKQYKPQDRGNNLFHVISF